MGIYINRGSKQFKVSLNSKIYVDKSGIIARLNEYIDTPQKYVCVSRPRRFGKSVTAGMLLAYYSAGTDSSSLFNTLIISADSSYKQHLNRYNTIFINMTDEFNMAGTDVPAMIASVTAAVNDELRTLSVAAGVSPADSLARSLMKVYAQTQVPFVIIIDEWDCVMREKAGDEAGIRQYLEWLKILLKDKEYAGLAYLTGILPIKKYGSHSALNMFDEVSMLNPAEYTLYTGFTQEEVRQLCDKHAVSFAKMQKWYDGYAFRDVPHVYNPNSVVRAIIEQEFSSYWTQTETSESLRKYIDLNYAGLRDDVVKLAAGQTLKIRTAGFQNDMTTFASKDDVLTLLLHLGYLAKSISPEQDQDSGSVCTVRIPNEEIRREFMDILQDDDNYKGVYALIERTETLLSCILDERCDEVARLFDEAHQEHTSVLRYNDENSLACVVTLSLLLTGDIYSVYREMPAGKGFADLVYLPKKGVNRPALLLELKADAGAQTALEQIRERNYPQGLKDYQGEIYLVGISYSKTDKTHECRIERIRKE